MVEIDQVMADEELKSKIAAIGAGVLVIIAGFMVYNYFSKVGTEDGILNQEAALLEELDETTSDNDQVAETEENTLNEDSQTAGSDSNTDTDETVAASDESVSNWQATNYQEGDISGENYTVKSGDTLWEIAEARYGSGFDWTKILEANKDSISYLPNGSQALIVPGQVLNLP